MQQQIINMKYFLILLFTAIYGLACAQSKSELEVLANTRLLGNTVFGTKDSLTLEKLFATRATYGHSNGKIETREEAIRNIINNKSVYAKADTIIHYEVTMQDETAIVRHPFQATETKENGAQSPLNLSIMLVWVKEKGQWKLMGRQAVRIQ